MDFKEPVAKNSIATLFMAVSFVVLYGQVAQKMVQDWASDDNYSHGFLIPVIAGYLVWQKKDELKKIVPRPSGWGLVLFVLSLVVFIMAKTGSELFTMRASVITLILSAVVFGAGWAWAKKVFFPVAYLIFMVPFPSIVWNKIAFPLKLFATKMAVVIIRVLTIPVHAEGNIINLSNTTLEVVDACSGLRSLTSLLALSAAFALISGMGPLKKTLLFLSAVPIAIVVNIIRLAATAVFARFMGPGVAKGFLHDFSGIVVFVFAFFLIVLVYRLLSMWPGKDTHATETADIA